MRARSGDEARCGFVGSATLAGAPDDLARASAVLRWGAALGVGKGTLQGAGRFVVGPVPETARVELPINPPQRRSPSLPPKPRDAMRRPPRTAGRPRDRKRKR